jgi:RNA polymerase sigma factor (sigma-70 family)
LKIPKLNKPGDWLATRQSLLRRLRAQAGCEGWQAFFDAYWRLLYAVARRAGLTESEAQQGVQETVRSVCQQFCQFDADPERVSVKLWLMQMTRWRITDQLRKRLPDLSRAEAPTDSVWLAGASSGGFETLWEEEWQKHCFAAALERVKARVKPNHFQIFDLCVIRQWPLTKVAAVLKVSGAQVYLTKHRLTALLKREIYGDDGRLIASLRGALRSTPSR